MALSRLLLVFTLAAIALDAQAPTAGAPTQVQPPVVRRRSQPPNRTIQGRVLDSKGASVPNAVVLLKNTKTLEVRSYLADENGAYHFYGLSFDVNYELRAQANGLTSAQKTVSVFDSHPIVKLNLKLKKKFKAERS